MVIRVWKRRCFGIKTYDEVYDTMKQRYITLSGVTPDDESDIGIKLKLLAGEIYNALSNFEWLKNQMFAETAGGIYLDYIAEQRGLQRKAGKKAKGEIEFSISEATDHNIYIPKGAIVSTNDANPIRFCTTEEGEITQGNTLVALYAEALNEGKNGNVLPDTITVAVSVPSEIEKIVNHYDFEDGADEETDDELRERILRSYTSTPNGTNKAFYEQQALTVEGIAKANAVMGTGGAGTVNVYVCGSNGKAQASAVSEVQSLLENLRELNVKVTVRNADFVIQNLDVEVTAKPGYSTLEVKSLCAQAFNNYIKSLDIGETFYLSSLGKYLLDTNCIQNYVYDVTMDNKYISGSECMKAGITNITVV